MIESCNNQLIKKYSKLKDKKYRELYNMFIVEGKHLVDEAIKNANIIDIFSLDGSIGTKVSSKVMKKLSSLDTIPSIVAICKKLSTREIKGNILILDDIKDPGNLGTIIRTCVAFNIDTIVASNNTVDLYNSKVIRSSEGMIFNINYIQEDLAIFISKLKGYKILTTDVTKGKDIKLFKSLSKIALIVGNEGSGVKEDIKALSDEYVSIPMSNNCESLNVGVATGILLYELFSK